MNSRRFYFGIQSSFLWGRLIHTERFSFNIVSFKSDFILLFGVIVICFIQQFTLDESFLGRNVKDFISNFKIFLGRRLHAVIKVWENRSWRLPPRFLSILVKTVRVQESTLITVPVGERPIWALTRPLFRPLLIWGVISWKCNNSLRVFGTGCLWDIDWLDLLSLHKLLRAKLLL